MIDEIELKEEKPRYALVELSQLEKLFQRCFNCGKLPGGPKTGKERNVTWTKTGTSMTAIIRCSCVNKGRLRWSTQDIEPDTNYHTGNISIVAAAHASAVSFSQLDSLFTSAEIASMSKMSFLRITKKFVYPAIEDTYYAMQSDLLRDVENPIEISMDGQFDSPGFTAEYCTVTAIESQTKQVLAFSTVQKKETNNVSSLMAVEGVMKTIAELEKHVKVGTVTVDKNPTVCKRLRDNGYSYNFDPWHIMKKMRKEIRDHSKHLQGDEKLEFTTLSRRFMLHVFKSIEASEGNSGICIEKMLSFFLHVQNIHRWQNDRFSNLIHVAVGTKTGRDFDSGSFTHVFSCMHPGNSASKHDPVTPDSRSYQFLLEMATKNIFISDLKLIKYGNMTSEVESFHNVCIVFRPKRKFYTLHGYNIRTMLAAIHFNMNKEAEKRGERTAKYEYRYYSKAQGAYRTKMKRGPPFQGWKVELVKKAHVKAQNYVPEDQELEVLDDEHDVFDQRLAELLVFDDDEEGLVDPEDYEME